VSGDSEKAKKNKDENRKSEKDEKKKNRQARHQKKRSISAIESSTLEESIPLNPKIFQQLCTYIEHRGLGIEGLLRISGEIRNGKTFVQTMQQRAWPRFE